MATLDDLPLRDDLRGHTPYGAPQLDVPIRLNVNENAHPVPETAARDIIENIARELLTANRYPDREFTELRHALAGYLGHNTQPEQIWAANGSNEVLQHALQAFGGPGRTALGFTPTYSMHPIITTGTGTRWISGTRDPGYQLTPDTVTTQIQQHNPDIVFLCSPNNPTGTPLALDTIEAAYNASRGIVIVDEAYIEFAPHGTPSALKLLPGRERLLISRTMSKAFAFAGARIGYLAADPAVTDALRLVRLPYHLSALTQAAATAALGHADALLANVADIRAQRDRILTALPKLGHPTLPSHANFVLFGGVTDPKATFQALLDRGILIRDVGIPNHLRVTAGTEPETTAFLNAMAELAATSGTPARK